MKGMFTNIGQQEQLGRKPDTSLFSTLPSSWLCSKQLCLPAEFLVTVWVSVYDLANVILNLLVYLCYFTVSSNISPLFSEQYHIESHAWILLLLLRDTLQTYLFHPVASGVFLLFIYEHIQRLPEISLAIPSIWQVMMTS